MPEQAITVPQAVLLYTSRPANLTRFDGSLSQIAPGLEGSFVILDRGIFTIDAEELDGTQVRQTWIQGEKVYDREK